MGYGYFWDGKRRTYAHRWSYEHHVTAIPAGMTVDHLCRNPSCVNPAHMENRDSRREQPAQARAQDDLPEWPSV